MLHVNSGVEEGFLPPFKGIWTKHKVEKHLVSGSGVKQLEAQAYQLQTLILGKLFTVSLSLSFSICRITISLVHRRVFVRIQV